MTEFVDVVIVGAGISGISAAWHLQEHCPGKNYVILERREQLGGTWDLFKYPGIGRIPTCTPSGSTSSRGRPTR